MRYTLSFDKAHQNYLDITLEIDSKGADQLRFQLPAWRPGRYELSNFAKNIQKWEVFDENNNALKFSKKTKDLWEVDCKDSKKVLVKYNYFANELNAGSTYLDENQLYVNPVNCLMYEEQHLDTTCHLELKLPKNFQCATSLKSKEQFSFLAENFDELADSPFICSPNLQNETYEIDETTFHLWFQGIFKPDWKLLKKDFQAFSQEQMKLFGGFPGDEFHFLFQILPTATYHGVEHASSTVIALGPSYSLLKKSGRYEDLLGVSSHELFHAWNVKRIRPIEMWPYDFTKENYTKMGYLTEGATTWYGDIMLYRSGVFDDEAFFRTFNQLLSRHYNNPGVLNLSVAASSFDTWLDGYVPGVPNRKSSIYAEGALITFFLDVEIRKATENQQSFDQVLQSFYKDFYLKGKGISEEDYRAVVEKIAGKKMDHIFNNFIYGKEDFSKQLKESFDFLGLEMTQKPSDFVHETYMGIRLLNDEVFSIYPDSPADLAGFSIGDKPVQINGIEINQNFSEWLEYFINEEITVGLMRKNGTYAELKLKSTNKKMYYSNYVVSKLKNLNASQKKAYDAWMLTSDFH